jgi:hypothetical protein
LPSGRDFALYAADAGISGRDAWRALYVVNVLQLELEILRKALEDASTIGKSGIEKLNVAVVVVIVVFSIFHRLDMIHLGGVTV